MISQRASRFSQIRPWCAALMLMWFCTLGAAPPAYGQNGRINELIKKLHDPDITVPIMEKTIRELVEIGTSAVEPLIVALKDPNQKVQVWAAEALGRIKDPRAIEPLRTALIGPDRLIASSARDALDQIEHLLAAKAEADALKDSTGRVPDPAAITGLISALKNPWASRHPRGCSGWHATEVLGKVGAPAVEPLIAALRDDVQGQARVALGMIGEPAVEALIAALRDPNAGVRSRAADALGFTKAPRAVEPLIAAWKDSDQEVRLAAVRSVGLIRDPRAVEPLIAALDSPDGTGRMRIGALGKIGAPAVDPLIAALKDSKLRRNSAKALAATNDPRGADAVLALLRGGDAKIIDQIHEAVIAIGEPGSEGGLIKALDESNDLSMAQDLLNSGNSKLEKAARDWAARHSVPIRSVVAGGGVGWGSSH